MLLNSEALTFVKEFEKTVFEIRNYMSVWIKQALIRNQSLMNWTIFSMKKKINNLKNYWNNLLVSEICGFLLKNFTFYFASRNFLQQYNLENSHEIRKL